MDSFIATKRVGSILRSAQSLTWLQATEVLKLLDGPYGEEIDAALLLKAREVFKVDVEFAADDSSHHDPLPSYLSRGQIYHSKRVCFTYNGFQMLLGVSFTVCVKLDVPFLHEPARASQSKFWCSAIINGERPTEATGEEAFANLCERISHFAVVFLETAKPLYGNAVRAVNDKVEEIESTGDIFNSLVFQIPDDDFREQLYLIEDGKKRLRDLPADSALGLLNHFYSGPHARVYLHGGRGDDQADCDLGYSIDTSVHQDRLKARALVIETRDERAETADWRILGVTSASEPVHRDPEAKGRVYELLHSPANILSAGMTAEIGEQF